MEIAQLILSGLIILGIFYVVFIQDRSKKIKNGLLKFLKEYPKAAEAFIRMEKSRIEEEIESKFLAKMKAIFDEISEGNKMYREILGRVVSEYARLIGKIIVATGYNPLIERFIEEIEYDAVKEPIKEFYSSLKKIEER